MLVTSVSLFFWGKYLLIFMILRMARRAVWNILCHFFFISTLWKALIDLTFFFNGTQQGQLCSNVLSCKLRAICIYSLYSYNKIFCKIKAFRVFLYSLSPSWLRLGFMVDKGLHVNTLKLSHAWLMHGWDGWAIGCNRNVYYYYFFLLFIALAIKAFMALCIPFGQKFMDARSKDALLTLLKWKVTHILIHSYILGD